MPARPSSSTATHRSTFRQSSASSIGGSTLAHLVAAWAKGSTVSPLVVGGPASTLALASDLARLIDDMVTRDVSWDRLDGLVPDNLDEYWKLSLDFLRIARKLWPDHLKEIGKIEPAARRDLSDIS